MTLVPKLHTPIAVGAVEGVESNPLHPFYSKPKASRRVVLVVPTFSSLMYIQVSNI